MFISDLLHKVLQMYLLQNVFSITSKSRHFPHEPKKHADQSICNIYDD